MYVLTIVFNGVGEKNEEDISPSGLCLPMWVRCGGETSAVMCPDIDLCPESHEFHSFIPHHGCCLVQYIVG